MNRREVLAGATAMLTAATLDAAFAEFRPTRPIEFVVHGGPGSGNDVFARALIAIIDQEKLSPVRLQVANKPGGGATAAAAYVMSKKGDPHVIACWTNVWITDTLVQEAAHNRIQDMTPIARLVVEPAIVVVKADSPLKTMKDFIDAAKAKPGALKMSGGSITSRENIVRQLLSKVTGARWAFISFPSGGERIAALLGGHVDMMIVDPSEAGEQVRAGKLRMIAQVNDRRLPGFPDVPTLKEAGYDIPNVPQMRGVLGAPGMPADAVAFYEDLFRKASTSAMWQKFLSDSQLDGEFVKAAELTAFLSTFEGTLREILKEAGAKVVR
ncbi:MAG: putative tricarboxylic transport rane protein [Alphaproteobacteria bacterium]|jgi:putative tricarboxylic transport membrane protein|nr:putative tricarboxylic transport rane protein [Alphaproteobacteria bacterium]